MEIELYSKLQNPIEAIDRIGEMFARSGMFGCERAEQGKVLAMICLAENKSPVAITRDFDIVDGKLRKKAMAAFADFRSKGGKVKWLKTGDDGIEAKAEIGFEGQVVTVSFTIEQAKAQGLVRPKSNWEKTPGNMLRARVVSNAIGMLCPEIYAGDDTEETPRVERALDLQPVAQPAAEPKPAKVVELHPVNPDEKQEAKMGLAPATEATPTTTAAEPAAATEPKFAAGPKYDAPATPLLSDALAAEVEKAIADTPEDLARAYKWMSKEGWLKDGQDLRYLTDARARRIIKQRDSFRKAVKEANL